VQATSLNFRAVEDRWYEYEVEDGTRLRIKPVATEVLRLDGEYDADGNPLYLLKTGNVMSVLSPEALRRTLTLSAYVPRSTQATTTSNSDSSQEWFWTESWQRGERAADEDIAAGRVQHFDDLKSFLAELEDN